MKSGRWVPAAGAGLLGAVLLACAALGLGGTPRNGWSKRKWGPLVPHETFPADCALCHVADRWDELKPEFAFDHAKETGVALEGAHAEAACLRCHNDFGPVKSFTARGCAGCHADPHEGQLGGDCLQCHNESTWRPQGLVAEHARTRFPLVGAHLAAACEKCHVRAPTGDYRGAPVECEVCHRDDLARATSPDHAAQGWTSGCDRCHFPSTWGAGGFLHAFFPLTGGHGGLACTACHTSGTFTPLPTDCISCHADDYQGAPNHVASNYPQDCRQCHSISSWKGAVINHDFFPLQGGHAGLDCSRCHVSGTTGPIPSACYSCHRSDYEGAANHVSLNFPTDCEACHTIQRWTGATFRHTFPLQGEHNVSCNVCHPSGTQTFTCLVCHEHRQSEMDAKHREVGGYRYASADCYRCHRNGRGD